jgi:hypothetical protein
LKFRDAIDDVDRQAEAINFIVDGKFHRSIDIALFLVTPYVEVRMVRATVGQAVNQPGITMKVKNNRFVDCAQCWAAA